MIAGTVANGFDPSFFEDAVEDNRGPGYFCPYIDPLWSVERVQAALEADPSR